MSVDEILWAAHNFATMYMTGLIWFVQLVHYPSFRNVPEQGYPQFALSHQKDTSLAVIPAMLVELGTGFLFCMNIYRPATLSWHFAIGLFGMTLLIWASTFLLQVPMHNILGQKYHGRAIEILVKTNWIRTLLWTARSFLIVFVNLKS